MSETKAILLSWIRVFIATFLTALLTALTTSANLDWKSFGIAGLVAVLPVIINWLNGNDSRYGRGYEGA